MSNYSVLELSKTNHYKNIVSSRREIEITSKLETLNSDIKNIDDKLDKLIGISYLTCSTCFLGFFMYILDKALL